MESKVEMREQVRERYARAATTGSCCGPECCGHDETLDADLTAGTYSQADISALPTQAVEASLGCGNPTAVADLSEGETVLDLGSGGGIDVLLSARRVGETGFAYGLDMTDEMLELASQERSRSRGDQRRIPQGVHRGDPSPRQLGRRGHLQLCHQPLDRQADSVR